MYLIFFKAILQNLYDTVKLIKLIIIPLPNYLCDIVLTQR